MSILDVIAKREISEVLHFTTHLGLVGILDSQRLKSRARLSADRRLEYILRLNTPTVKDPEWEDYINLSITIINRSFFSSSLHWHEDASWRILSFDPIILTHQDVHFVTTNNTYPVARRATGAAGLEALFGPSVPWGYYGSVKHRPTNLAANLTTCDQAEVLYPGEIPTEFLRCVYVNTEEDQDEVYGQTAALSHPAINVVLDQTRFHGSA